MPFRIGMKEIAKSAAGYAKLEFSVLSWGYLLVLIVLLIHRYLYWRLHGVPRGSTIFPGKGIGGGRHLGVSGDPSLGVRVRGIQQLQ